MTSGLPEKRTPTDVKANGPTEILGGFGGIGRRENEELISRIGRTLYSKVADFNTVNAASRFQRRTTRDRVLPGSESNAVPENAGSAVLPLIFGDPSYGFSLIIP